MILWGCVRKTLICLRYLLKYSRMKYDVWVEVGEEAGGMDQIRLT